MEQEIIRFENKMKSCTSMTDLLIAMSAWQGFCRNNTLTDEQKRRVDEAYLTTEAQLIKQVKTSLW